MNTVLKQFKPFKQNQVLVCTFLREKEKGIFLCFAACLQVYVRICMLYLLAGVENTPRIMSLPCILMMGLVEWSRLK